MGLTDKPPVRIVEPPYTGTTFNDVLRHATTRLPNGTIGIDLRKVDQLEGVHGYNGGRGCDVLSGPCSCGAWH